MEYKIERNRNAMSTVEMFEVMKANLILISNHFSGKITITLKNNEVKEYYGHHLIRKMNKFLKHNDLDDVKVINLECYWMGFIFEQVDDNLWNYNAVSITRTKAIS